MNKHVVSAALWVYVGWYAGSLLADLFEASALIGLMPGMAIAGIVVASFARSASVPRIRDEVDAMSGPPDLR